MVKAFVFPSIDLGDESLKKHVLRIVFLGEGSGGAPGGAGQGEIEQGASEQGGPEGTIERKDSPQSHLFDRRVSTLRRQREEETEGVSKQQSDPVAINHRRTSRKHQLEDSRTGQSKEGSTFVMAGLIFPSVSRCLLAWVFAVATLLQLLFFPRTFSPLLRLFQP